MFVMCVLPPNPMAGYNIKYHMMHPFDLLFQLPCVCVCYHVCVLPWCVLPCVRACVCHAKGLKFVFCVLNITRHSR